MIEFIYYTLDADFSGIKKNATLHKASSADDAEQCLKRLIKERWPGYEMTCLVRSSLEGFSKKSVQKPRLKDIDKWAKKLHPSLKAESFFVISPKHTTAGRYWWVVPRFALLFPLV